MRIARVEDAPLMEVSINGKKPIGRDRDGIGGTCNCMEQ